MPPARRRRRPTKVTVRGQRRIFDDVFAIDEAQVSFERYDGTTAGPARRLVFERGDSVAAVVFLIDTRRVLLTEQFRYPTWAKKPGWVVELVAGMIDGNEKPAAAMRREIAEEIGYRARRLERIATVYVSPGGSSERVWLYAADVDAAARVGDGGGVATEHEDIRLVSWTLAEAADAIAKRTIVDAKTLVGLQWLLARERR